MIKKILVIFLLLFTCINVKAAEIDVNAQSAILIEYSTGKILYEKEKDTRLSMASMTKIMSLLLIMEQISLGNISYDEDVIISKEASDMGGSQVFLQTGDVYKVSELLKSVAMASANDAIVALAEKTYGTTADFVNAMNNKAKALGLKNTNFENVHGLDSENHYSSAYDMAIMAQNLLKYEDILNYTSVYEEYLQKNDGSKIWLVNTNKLIRFYQGVDGLKTGYTVNAGYCITATAKKNNLRLISVVMHDDTLEQRSADTVKLLNYGFNSYKVNTIKEKGSSLGKIKVYKGKKDYVDVILKEDALELLSVQDKISKYDYKLSINKVVAPVKKGDTIGYVEIYDQNKNLINKADITVKEDVLKANLWDYIMQNLRVLVSFK